MTAAPVTAALEPGRLRAGLVTAGSPWLEVEHHDTIGSTNARAAQLARPWVVVVADHQSAGRGRLGRRWEALPGASVAVSATLPLTETGARAQGWVPLLTGLAMAEAIESTTGLAAVLKWPNDVLLPGDGDRKVCGILCEVVPAARPAGPGGLPGQLVVVGAGVNVDQTRDQLPVERATSLALASGTAAGDLDRTDLVEAYLRRLGAPRTDAPIAAYRRRCSTIGQEVRLTLPSGGGPHEVVGTAVDVDEQGRLVIDGPGGRHAWAAGDVVHVRPRLAER